MPPKKSIVEFFAQLPDPRVERTRRHNLIDIIVIAICGVISGAEPWTEIEDYAESKEESGVYLGNFSSQTFSE